MKKFICDRCGKECSGLKNITIDDFGEKKAYDLCDACFIGLEQYMNGWEIYVKNKEKKNE